MFRKKKVGTVQVYSDDEDVSSPGRGRGDDFDDLGLGGDSRGGDLDEADIAQMSGQQLEDAALAQARDGREGTKRALAMALETREIGGATAQRMREQTEQLEKMGENIEEVHDYLDKSEKIIDKMSKPKIVRMFTRDKKKGKGLDKLKAGKRELAEREKLKASGLGAVELGDDGGSGGSDNENREELFTVTDAKKGKKRKGKKGSPESGSRAVQEDYSQYTSGVASAMRAQDDDLDQISDALGDLKALADGMNSELGYQGKLIDEVQTFTEETSNRTKKHANRVNNIK